MILKNGKDSMQVTGLKCKKCGETIVSKHRHDMRWCKCGACAIDGGRDYCKITGNESDFEIVRVELPGNRD